MSILGVTSTEGMAGSTAVLEGLAAQMAAAATANGATAALVLPAGNEGASALALAQQNVSAAMFSTNFALGIKEFVGMITTLGVVGPTYEATSLAGAKLL